MASADCLIIVQARLASTRLPAKALLPVGGVPSFVLCARRAANTGLRTVVATSDEAVDDVLAATGRAAGIEVVRGARDDVLSRFALASAALPDVGTVVRLTADNVVPDGHFVEMLLDEFRRRSVDYLGTSSPEDGLPYGLSAEVFTAGALRRAQAAARDAFDREHVTPWLRRECSGAPYVHAGAAASWAGLRCTLDTFEDYARLQRVFAGEPDATRVPWQALVDRFETDAGPWVGLHCPRKAGADGRTHSVLTLGTAQLGLRYGIANHVGLPADAEAGRLLNAAVEAGIASLDTARAYGCAEDRIGALLSPGQRARVAVVTKLDPLAGMPDDASARCVVDAVDASVFRSAHGLRERVLDTLLLHRWAHRHAWGGAAWKRLLEWKSEGLVRRLGASVASVDEALAALDDPQVEHLQCPVNAVDARWRDPRFLAAVTARPDVTVHARSTLLQGLLGLPAARWPDVAGYDRAAVVSVLDEQVAALGRSDRIDLCLAYVRGLPWVHSMVLGMETLEQLKQNLALAGRPALSRPERERLDERMPMLPQTVLDPARWGSAHA